MSEAHKFYLKVLKTLRKKFSNKEKWSEEIDKIMKHLIGQKAKKTIAWNQYNPGRNKNGNYTVINTGASNQTGMHWVGVYQEGNEIYVYDSFGRHINHILHGFYEKMKKKGYNVIDVTHTGDQGNYQQDCGLRAITWLYLVKYGGLQYALSIH